MIEKVYNNVRDSQTTVMYYISGFSDTRFWWNGGRRWFFKRR